MCTLHIQYHCYPSPILFFSSSRCRKTSGDDHFRSDTNTWWWSSWSLLTFTCEDKNRWLWALYGRWNMNVVVVHSNSKEFLLSANVADGLVHYEYRTATWTRRLVTFCSTIFKDVICCSMATFIVISPTSGLQRNMWLCICYVVSIQAGRVANRSMIWSYTLVDTVCHSTWSSHAHASGLVSELC